MYYPIILILLFFTELLYIYFAYKYNIVDKPDKRSSHKHVALRGGGIIFYFGTLFFFIAHPIQYPWFLLGLTLITFISFWDDIRPISQAIRLIFHFAAMFLLCMQWDIFTLPLWGILAILIIGVGIINAYNFMDGINGITCGFSLVTLVSLAYINEFVVKFVEQTFILTVLCSVIVFCLFNFRQKAKCFVGDVGSVGIAFIIVFMIGLLIVKTNDFTWLVFLSVYGIDSVLTIIHRIIIHEDIRLPHRCHLYQIMANELGIPHVKVAFVYMGMQSVINIGYLEFREFGYWYLLISIFTLSIIYVIFMKKYFKLHLNV